MSFGMLGCGLCKTEGSWPAGAVSDYKPRRHKGMCARPDAKRFLKAYVKFLNGRVEVKPLADSYADRQRTLGCHRFGQCGTCGHTVQPGRNCATQTQRTGQIVQQHEPHRGFPSIRSRSRISRAGICRNAKLIKLSFAKLVHRAR
jgi:hypothetical protein